MPQPLKPKIIRNLGIYGVIREAEVDSNLIPEGAVTEAMNFSFDRKGSTTIRSGVAGLGSTVVAGAPCLGLFNAQGGTLVAAFLSAGSTTIFRYNGNAWVSSLSGFASTSKIRFADFTGRTIAVSSLERSIQVYNGSTDGAWSTSGNPINPQQLWYTNANTNSGYIRPAFIEVYKARIYLSGDSVNPDRLYFSNIISSAGNVAWTPAFDFIDINPSDGENITALKRYSLELLIFKPNYIYRFKVSTLDPDPLIKIGTRSQESIIEGKRGMYFHHDSGFYRYTGGLPVEISRPISDFVLAIPFSQYSSIVAWNDPDHIYWSIGNITIAETQGDVLWRNVVVRYTESSDIWTIYSYANEPRRGSIFNSASASTLTRAIGTDHGVVATFDSGTTDLAEPIKYRLITKWYEWEGIFNRKIITRMVVLCEKAQEMFLMYQTDNNPEWQPIGQLRKYANFFRLNSVRFHRIRFKITGITTREPPIFQGLEIFEGINEGIIMEQ